MAKANKPYLEFRFKKVAMIGDLGDGVYYQIPTRMIAKPNPQFSGEKTILNVLTGKTTIDPQSEIVEPDFNLEFVHKIELKDERPTIPKKGTLSDSFYEKLCDQAYEKAAQAKLYNDGIRRKVHAYAEGGTIEVISDPFAGGEEVEGLDAIAEILKTEEPTDKSTIKARKNVAS